MSWKLSSRPKISHLTIHFKVIVIIVRFDLSSFTYAIVFLSIHIDQAILLYWWLSFDQ
jgi:hypothetical protein